MCKVIEIAFSIFWLVGTNLGLPLLGSGLADLD